MPTQRATLGRASQPGRLGTFAGVFTPSILTILGLILFLRMGFVVGHGGLGKALLILAIATLITTLTSVSLSAIATNMRVKGGGDYYLISRTLGPGFGGALGIVLFLAQSVSIAFYCIGFAEAVASIAGWEQPHVQRLIAASAAAFIFVLAWLGTDWATRFQYVVMIVLTAALVSFFAGGLWHWRTTTLIESWSSPSGGLPFWTLFAIFFPAVTGFTQGVSMSGDLKDPSVSLPRGTFWAIAVSTVVYLAVAIVLAASMPLADVARDNSAVQRVARFEFPIIAGIVAATLSSAMASFLGAPRILQAMAKDRIFTFLSPLARGHGPTDNPRSAILVSSAIAAIVIAAGDLNIVAPIVSMFFLISYGLLNYATFYEARASSPSFRPTFRWYDARLSLLGALGCLGAMVAIDPRAGAAACAVIFGVYQYLKSRARLVGFRDSRRAHAFQRVRTHLQAMQREPEHARDWRPQILVFSDDPHRRDRLLQFASWIEGGSGIATVVRIIEGHGAHARKMARESEKELRAEIDRQNFGVFALAVVAPSLDVGVELLLQSHGLGPVTNNTVLLNWLDDAPFHDEQGELRYCQRIRSILRHQRNVIVLVSDEADWEKLKSIPPQQRRIDVWWWGRGTSRLMLLLAYLMTRTELWEDAAIRVYSSVSNGQTTEEALSELRHTLEEVRIDAEAEVLSSVSSDEIVRRSQDATMVFLPLRFRDDQLAAPVDAPMSELLARLPACAMCSAGQDIELDAEPDAGIQAERAEAAQALNRARERLEALEAKATEAAREANDRVKELEKVAHGSKGAEAVAEATRAARAAEEESASQARRVAKAIAKVEAASSEAQKFGVQTEEPSEQHASSQPPPSK